jgi:hypothetical protein
MAKNIVMCCDGTGQKLDVHRTNVVRLFTVLEASHPNIQINYYDPGVGTLPAEGALTSFSRHLTLRAGYLAGYGLYEKVSQAYRYLIEQYEEGDKIYLLGFSRGAFTVRVLAGLLHRIGVLRRGAKNLVPYALELYKPHYTLIENDQDREGVRRVADEFRALFCRPGRVGITFLGLWDTVKAFGIFRPISLPHIRHNPDVEVVRHALALDECRRSFIPSSWGGLDDYVEEPASHRQDVQEVWFRGSHSDIGGGYSDDESGLSWISFRWMVAEANKFGLLLNQEQLAKMLPSNKPIDWEAKFWKPHESRTRMYRLSDQIPRPELINAPLRDGCEDKKLLDGLSVPRAWPKKVWRVRPTCGKRDIEHFKRNNRVLVHASVRKQVEARIYELQLDPTLIKYVQEDGYEDDRVAPIQTRAYR